MTICDRCGADISNVRSNWIGGYDERRVESDDTGPTDEADLCAACYRGFLEWLRPSTRVSDARSLIPDGVERPDRGKGRPS